MMDPLEWNEGTVHMEGHFRYRIQIFVACVLLVLSSVFACFASGAQPGKTVPKEPETNIRILVLVDATKPLTVRYETKGGVILGNLSVIGLAPLLIDAAATSLEKSKESQALQQTVGKFERRPVMEAGIAAMFKASTPYFEAVIPPDPSLYTGGTGIDFNKAQADGFPYVLVIREEFAGMATMWAWGTLSAGSYVHFRLMDAATGKELAKGQTNAFASRAQKLDAATTDRSIFVADYAAAVAQECIHIYGELYKQGQLHSMAEAHGLGKEVPDTAALLRKYEQLFNYDFTLPKDWHQVAGSSKYQLFLEPKNADRAKFGVNFTMDLLIEELGQKVQDLNEYIRIVFGRLRDQGYAVDTAISFDALALNPPYTAFVIDRPKGSGKEVVLFRRLDDPFVVTYHVVFLEDYDGFLKKYGQDLQLLINQAKITTHP